MSNTLTQAKVTAVMDRLWNGRDLETYNKLWDAMHTLKALGLVETDLIDAMFHEDTRLFESDGDRP